MPHLDAVAGCCQGIRLLGKLRPGLAVQRGAVGGIEAQMGVILVQDGLIVPHCPVCHGLLTEAEPQCPAPAALLQGFLLGGLRFAQQFAPCLEMLPGDGAVVPVAQSEIFRIQHLKAHHMRRHMMAAFHLRRLTGQLLLV